MKKICNFVTGNMQMLALIYAIMAVIVFAAVNIFFWKISFDLDKEMREEMRECGDYHIDTDEARFGKTVTRVCGFILSIPAALMWWATPLIVGGLMLYDRIQEKNPDHFISKSHNHITKDTVIHIQWQALHP